MKLLFVLFFIGLAGSSIYVFPSGNPQPTDILLALLAFSLLLTRIRNLSGMKLLWPMAGLTLWVTVVAIVWSGLYPDGNFLRYPIFYLFNFVFMLAVVNLFLTLHQPVGFFCRAIEAALLISGIGILISFAMPGVGFTEEARASGRIQGFFNNPNQLAYYSLCMLGALLVLHRGKLPTSIVSITALAFGVLGIFMAASLAAMAGLVCFLLSILAANWRSSKRTFKVLGAGLSILLLLVSFDIYTDGAVSDRVKTRMDRLDRKLEAVETERGYDRILAHRAYLILGAGEGSVERFSSHETHEIHSSFGTLLFSYGVIGLTLFSVIIWRSLKFAPFYVWLILAAPLTYSLTHMGLRSTAFWLLVVLVLLLHGGNKSRSSPNSLVRNKTPQERVRAFR